MLRRDGLAAQLLLGGQTSGTGVCTRRTRNVDAVVFAASAGQTITTHQGRQLAVTKISLPCDWAPMFGRPEPNLTHFVRTIEEN